MLKTRVLFGCWMLWQTLLHLTIAPPACANDPKPQAGAHAVVFADNRLYHLRQHGQREWTSFDAMPDASELVLEFPASRNEEAACLQLRQQDVKQRWQVALNGQPLGDLQINEIDLRALFEIPAGILRDGKNQLSVKQLGSADAAPDDIRVGSIIIDSRPVDEILNESRISVRVVDSVTRAAIPARITIVDQEGSLPTVAAQSGAGLAVRTGTVYTADGAASFGVPAAKYRIIAGRGFEYSIAEETIQTSVAGEHEVELAIRRVVPTEGWVACDTHVHTLTHSGHGDASIEERMVTLAGEGIELPIATDHNKNIDYRDVARSVGVEKYFTPVIGNEVTTSVGHFNAFPIEATASPPDHRGDDWATVFGAIFGTPGVRVAILNHGRDLHGGNRPLGPRWHNTAVGANALGWSPQMNAMEVLNSAATQTDTLQLCRDWMTFLNRGYAVTPVGSSDSHDVARHFVGQGRTYIRCDDRDPGAIDISAAVDSFINGRVRVSYGLLVELIVNDKYTCGDFVRPGEGPSVADIRVWGPGWCSCDQVTLYANGIEVAAFAVDAGRVSGGPEGLLWTGRWTLPDVSHDFHLVAIATGSGIDESYWTTAKPYQPTASDWIPRTMACSGAVWIDADRDGRKSSAHDYAKQIFGECNGQLEQLVQALGEYDSAVAAQAAHLYQQTGRSWLEPEAQTVLATAASQTVEGIQDYIQAWKASVIAQAEGRN